MTKQSTFPSTPNAVNQPGLMSLSYGRFFSVPLALQNYYPSQMYSFKADKSIKIQILHFSSIYTSH